MRICRLLPAFINQQYYLQIIEINNIKYTNKNQ